MALVTQAGASSRSHLVRVQRGAPAPAGGTTLAAPSATSTQTGSVVLKPRNQAALTQFISGLTQRGSGHYHQYLSPSQFTARFGPSAATISAVKSALTAGGLKVTGVSSDGLLVHFTGTTSKVESTFGAKLQRFRSATGFTGQEATSAVTLPSSVASAVNAVVGLNTLVRPEGAFTRAPLSAHSGRAAAVKANITTYPTGSPKPCADANAAATSFSGLTDDQIANAYGAFGEYGVGDTGSGVHIGVFELEPFSQSDLATFDQCYFPAQAADMAARLTVKNVDGGQPAGPGSGESILDVEDVSAMAPGASIDVYEAPNTTSGTLDEYAQMVDDDQDKIISSSWGECEQDVATYLPGQQAAENEIFQQAAAQGQTVLSAAGDTGSDTCNEIRSTPPPTDQNPLSVNDPSSQPYVLAVGGTTLHDADPAHISESVWNDGADWGGGGGGLSASWGAPGWQLTAPDFPTPTNAESADYTEADTVEANSVQNGISDADSPWGSAPYFCAADSSAGYTASTPCRGVPDVTAQGDEFTGAITIYSAQFGAGPDGWITIGGTSSATPIWAGLLALVDASQDCKTNGVSAATGIGFANPLLYAVAANPAEYAKAFHDITQGNNDTYGFDDGKTFPAGPGYDLASGLGSPILVDPDGTPGLAADLCDLAGTVTPHPAVSGIAPAAGPVAGGTAVVVSGSGFAPTGGATVTGVTVGGYALPGADWRVVNDTTLDVTTPAAADMLPSGGGATGVQDGAGPAQIVVTLSNGVSSAIGVASQFSYVDQSGGSTVPSVTSLAPYAGLESGGSPVTVYGSGFAATGDIVKFGGVAASSYQFVNSHEIKVTPPAYSGSTDCATQTALENQAAALDSPDNDPAADDICQTVVQVSNTSGGSATDTLLPTYEGPALETDQDGLPQVPTGFEITPQPSEFDYVPAPSIAGVSTADPASYASAYGTSLIEVSGTGLNEQTLNAIDFGNPGLASSQDIEIAYDTGNTIYVLAPPSPDVASGSTPGPAPVTVPVSAFTMGGQSSGVDATYAGLPVVTGVSTGKTDSGIDINPAMMFDGGPVAVASADGGTPLTITGQGMSDLTGPLLYDDATQFVAGRDWSDATQHTYTVASDTSVTTQTLSQNPGLEDVEACTVTGCSLTSEKDEMLLYPDGAPSLTGIDVSSGPADGGTTVTLSGANLGCVTGVKFGSAKALSVDDFDANGDSATLDCGLGSAVTVVAPPGTAGASVPITLTTVESDATGGAAAVSPTQYTYAANPSAPATAFGSVTLGSSASGSVTVTNPGTTAVTLGTAALTGSNSGDFALGTDACSGAVLAGGKSCTIAVTFTPTASGARAASVDIPFDSSPTDISAALSGTGVIPTTTTTVTQPGQTTTVAGPTQTVPVFFVGTVTRTTTVTTPTTTVTKTIVCTVTPHTKVVTVKVKVHGKAKTEKKTEKYTTKTCKTESTKTTKTGGSTKTTDVHPAVMLGLSGLR